MRSSTTRNGRRRRPGRCRAPAGSPAPGDRRGPPETGTARRQTPGRGAISAPASAQPPRWVCRPAPAPSARPALRRATWCRATAPASTCPRLRGPPQRRTSSQGDDGTRGALLDALVNPGINPGHQLLEIGLRRHHLLIHRIGLHALERAVVLLDLLLSRFFPLLRDLLDLLRQPLRFGEHFLHALVLAQPFRRAAQRLVFVGLTEHAPQVFSLLFEH